MLQLKKKGRWALLFAALVSMVALVAVACGGDDDDSPSATNTPGGGGATPTKETGFDYGSLTGNIDIDGSSTVFPIGQAMAEDFSAVSNVRVNVALSGTGGGFEKFCRGETQISQASRPIKQSERDACAANGINDVVEIYVAIDALTVVTNPANSWAQCLTVEQVNAIFTDKANNWKDVDPSFPDGRIIKYYPGADSGTFDYFVEAVVKINKEDVHTSTGTSSEDDNILVLGVEGDRNAIGYFGFAYFQEAGDALNAVSIDDGDGCIEPTYDNAANGVYTPLSRPLFIYTTESLLKERPELVGFMHFYIENLEEIIPEVGYIAIPAADQDAQRAKLEPFLP